MQFGLLDQLDRIARLAQQGFMLAARQVARRLEQAVHQAQVDRLEGGLVRRPPIVVFNGDIRPQDFKLGDSPLVRPQRLRILAGGAVDAAQPPFQRHVQIAIFVLRICAQGPKRLLRQPQRLRVALLRFIELGQGV